MSALMIFNRMGSKKERLANKKVSSGTPTDLAFGHKKA
jgi:hypothetical protein